MNPTTRLVQALRFAYGAFRRKWTDPSGRQERFEAWSDWYSYLWALHENTVYDDFAKAAAYREQYGLWPNIRGLYNPARRVADFYAGFVYPGSLGTLAPESACPMESENEALIPAATSLFRWSNWQENKSVFVRRGAALGDTFAVIVDDLDRAKVYVDVLWPGHITDVDIDAQGNVKAYTLEYQADAGNGQTYAYRRTVDQESIRTWRNDKPYDYDGGGAERDNPYGFVPAVWCRHRNVGGDHGAPAIAGTYGKIDELNGLASALSDRILAVAESPLLLAGDGSARKALTQDGVEPDPVTPSRGRRPIRVLKMPQGTTSSMLDLKLADAYPHMDRLLSEIEQDLPELTWQRDMRNMSQVTGPGAQRLIQDVTSRLSDAQATYDLATTKLVQMGLAIGGWRLSSGAWGARSALTAHQSVFAPFDLDSYAAGDMEFRIGPRPLVTPTDRETVESLLLEMQLGISRQEALRQRGYSEEQIAAMEAENRIGDEDRARRLMSRFDRGL